MDISIPAPGSPVQAFVGGQMLKFTKVNEAIKEEFSLWAMSQAYERLEKLKSKLPRADYLRRLSNLDDKVDAGAYQWGFTLDPAGAGSGVRNAQAEGEGPARLALMLLREHHPTISLTEMNLLFKKEETESLEENRPNRLEEALKKALDPNSDSPASAGETLAMQSPTASATST